MVDFSAFFQFAQAFGLPLTLVVAALVVLARRTFVTKKEMDERLKAAADGEALAAKLAREDRDYVEDRRVEEREGRMRAEATTDKSLDLIKEQVGLLREIERELSRIGLLPPEGLSR